MELDIGDVTLARRGTPRKAALDALEQLLRAQAALSEHRVPEGPYGLLRPATDDELDLIEASFLHCGVPLPDTLRAIYRRTLGVGNPVASRPVLAVPFLRAVLPDEGFGCTAVGLAAAEGAPGRDRDDMALERPPFLQLGQAAPLGLTVSRSGLWSLRDHAGQREPPGAQDFDLVFEAAFCTLVRQALLVWANDLAGDLVRPRDLDVRRGARLEAMPAPVREALAHLVAPRTLGPRSWGEVQPLDNADLLRATSRGRGEAAAPAGSFPGLVTVVGLPYGDRPEVAGRIGPGDLLRPHPVDDNPYDPNAVEVWHDGEVPVRVGFVARAEAPGIRALPGGAQAWRLRVAARSDQALYARVELSRPARDDALGGDASPAAAVTGRDLFS